MEICCEPTGFLSERINRAYDEDLPLPDSSRSRTFAPRLILIEAAGLHGFASGASHGRTIACGFLAHCADENAMAGLRSRHGCVTCKRRKKKCDYTKPECWNCQRLQLRCEGYRTRVVFEDDPVKEGIRRRGPARKREQRAREAPVPADAAGVQGVQGVHAEDVTTISLSLVLSPVTPTSVPQLSPTDSLLWDCYINRFCKTYTTCTDESSPFLSLVVPLALRFEPVRHALLAVATLQPNPSPYTFTQASEFHRRKALEGCRSQADLPEDSTNNHVLTTPTMTPGGQSLQDLLHKSMCLATTSVLLLLAGKLSGYTYSRLKPYLANVRSTSQRLWSICHARIDEDSFHGRHFDFLRSVFAYYELLASLSATSNLQPESLNGGAGSSCDPGNFPSRSSSDHSALTGLSSQQLSHHSSSFVDLVWRINQHPELVSALEIGAWAGELDFMPSFAATSSTPCPSRSSQYLPRPESATFGTQESQLCLLRDIYRLALRIHHLKQLRNPPAHSRYSASLGVLSYTALAYPPFMAQEEVRKLATETLKLIRQMPCGCVYETALLLPLGVAAPELTHAKDRRWVVEKLVDLEERFGFRLFSECRRQLIEQWAEQQSRAGTHPLDTRKRVSQSSITGELLERARPVENGKTKDILL